MKLEEWATTLGFDGPLVVSKSTWIPLAVS